jgi:tetratricopeptide (TPR) repeat protein
MERWILMSDSKNDLFKKFQIAEPEPFGTDLDILIADPQSNIRLILTHHLQKIGFTKIRTVRDGMSALAEVRRQPANILILSSDLEGPSAHDVLLEMREDVTIRRDVVILCANPLNREQVMYAIECGFDDFLIKPIVLNEILPKIKSARAGFSSPKNPERIYEHAKFALRRKEIEYAEQIFSELAGQITDAARPHVGLAKVARMKGAHNDAVNNVQTALQRNKNYIHAHALLGDLHLDKGDVESAFQSYKFAIELSPLNLARYESAVTALMKANRIDDAIVLLTIAVKAGFEHPFIIERLGYCFFRQKDFQKAARFLRQAVAADPENISFKNSLAICYRDSKMLPEALELYNSILKSDNENHHVMFNKALVLNLMGRKEEAIKLLRRILAKHPDYQKAKDKIVEWGGTDSGSAA